jgi:transcriptional regulator with XRE-family HTH domain
MTHLGRLVADARKARGLTQQDLVRLAGYRNETKGLRRLRRIENGDDPLPAEHLLRPFVKALGLDEEAILMTLCSDFAALDEPTPTRVVIRLMPGFYRSLPLPEGCTVEQAVELAKRFSAEKNLSCCVCLSRIRSIYVEPSGSERLSFSPPGCSIALSAGLCDKVMLRLAKRLKDVPVEPGSRNLQ